MSESTEKTINTSLDKGSHYINGHMRIGKIHFGYDIDWTAWGLGVHFTVPKKNDWWFFIDIKFLCFALYCGVDW